MSYENDPIVNLNCGTVHFCAGEQEEIRKQKFKVKLDGEGCIDVLDIPRLPIGVIMPFAGNAIPADFLLCDGQRFDAVKYPKLYTLLECDRVPDYRGRTLIGAGAGDGLTNRDLGEKGGEEIHSLTVGEMPSHSHMYAPTEGDTLAPGSTKLHWIGGDEPYIATSSAGGNAAHNNMQPWGAVNYIIKAN